MNQKEYVYGLDDILNIFAMAFLTTTFFKLYSYC